MDIIQKEPIAVETQKASEVVQANKKEKEKQQ